MAYHQMPVSLPRVGSSFVAVLTLCFCFTAGPYAQLQLAQVVAVVVDAGGTPISSAIVVLVDPLGSELRGSATDSNGRATFFDVPPGRYVIRTRAPGAATFELPLTVNGALPMEVTIRVPAAVTDDVVVVGGQPAEPTSRVSFGGESLATIPVRVRSRGLQ